MTATITQDDLEWLASQPSSPSEGLRWLARQWTWERRFEELRVDHQDMAQKQ